MLFYFLEMSHRSKEFANICTEAENDMRELLYVLVYSNSLYTADFSCDKIA